MLALRRGVLRAAQRNVYLGLTSSRRFFSEEKKQEQETPAPAKPAAAKKSFDILSFIQDEVKNINEVISKSSAGRKPKRRLLEKDAKPTPQADFIKPIYTFDKEGNLMGVKYPTADEIPVEEHKEEEVVEEETEPEHTSLIIQESNQSVWGKRLDSLKEGIRSSPLVRPIVRLGANMDNSQNEYVKKINEFRYDVKDRVDDMKENYETSESGGLGFIRRTQDRISTSASDYAFQCILEELPYFSLEDFKDDMVTYQVPVAITAFFKGDVDVIASAFGDTAREAVLAITAKQEISKKFPDPTILDIKAFDIDMSEGIYVHNHKPRLSFSVVIDTIDCTRNEKGEVVEGSPHKIMPYYFKIVVEIEKHNPDFDWRIVEIAYQKMLGIQ